MRNSILWFLMLCNFAAYGQRDHAVTVISTSLVITPYEMRFANAGRSSTNCTGNSSVFGNFSNASVHCTSTDEPASETIQEHHLYTYYTVVKDTDNSYLLSCTRRFRWDHCPIMISGQTYTFDTKGSKVTLTQGAKTEKFELVQSIPNGGISSFSQNVAAVAGQATNEHISTVHVHVACNAEGADILLDGAFVGNAPSELQLTPGKHTIAVTRDGFSTWQRELTVSTGDINITATIHSITVSPK